MKVRSRKAAWIHFLRSIGARQNHSLPSVVVLGPGDLCEFSWVELLEQLIQDTSHTMIFNLGRSLDLATPSIQ